MKGTWPMIWNLFWKDTRQHARALLALTSSALTLPLVFALLAGSEGSTAGYSGFVFGYLALSAPILLSHWFIGQEKIKGTLRILRLLPVPMTAIIRTKCLWAALHGLLLINVTLILEPALCRYGGLALAQPSPALVLWANAVALLSLGLNAALLAAFDTRIAMQATIWLLCALLVLGYGAQRYLGRQNFEALAEHARIYAGSGAMVPAAACVSILALLLFALSAWLFERKEWPDLEEH
jgi:hypothetical protein